MKIPCIKNAFMNIKETCDKRIAELYPTNVPDAITSRYQHELTLLKNSDSVDDFEIFRLLSKETVKCSTIITMRGTVMGSFIYYLLGNNCFNPLPVHYYCPECGYFEAVETHLFGIDLPTKTCPQCKKCISADGYNLSPESVWGNDGNKSIDFSYNVSVEFMPFASRILTYLYPNNNIVPWGMFQFDPTAQSIPNNSKPVGVGLVGYVILPTGNTIQDYPDLISYLEDGEPCVTGGSWELKQHYLKPISLYSLEYIDFLIQLQRATGIYANEISYKELREVTWSNIFNATILNSTASSFFHELKPKTYKDMVGIISSSHSTFVWQELDQKDWYLYNNMISSDAFQKYPCFTREDFFDFLLETGVDKALAFDVSEKIRKGHANSAKFKDSFNTLQIPEEIKEVARNYLYIFPRAHCIEYMLIYARLAYYAKIDSRAFSKIMFKKKR